LNNQNTSRLTQYGWSAVFQNAFNSFTGEDLIPGRIIAHSRGKILAVTEQGELWCSIPGSFGRTLSSGVTGYCTGDWIAIKPYRDNSGGQLKGILPRTTLLKRQSTGNSSLSQTLAANVDTVCIIMGLDSNFNPARAERMAVLTWNSGAQPVVLLNKADLLEDPLPAVNRIEAAAPGVPVLPISAASGMGLEALRKFMVPGKTVVFMGSSGVGKSTLLNTLAGTALRKTQTVRESDGRGRHTTSLRELFLIPHLGCLIDTPGIREVGLCSDDEGLNSAFADVIGEIEGLAEDCRFDDCTHQGEPGCAVSDALAYGTISQERYRTYLKLKREIDFAASRDDDRLRRDREKKWKDIAKFSRELNKRKRV